MQDVLRFTSSLRLKQGLATVRAHPIIIVAILLGVFAAAHWPTEFVLFSLLMAYGLYLWFRVAWRLIIRPNYGFGLVNGEHAFSGAFFIGTALYVGDIKSPLFLIVSLLLAVLLILAFLMLRKRLATEKE